MSTCDQCGHEWCTTSAPGWFRCCRLLDAKSSKKPGRLFLSDSCNLIAHCPGCVGGVYHTVTILFCSLHQNIAIEAFPVLSQSSAHVSKSSVERE